MERESNAMPPMCRSGCGYYGNPAQDGLCSVCYKDLLRKKQQPPVSSTPSSNNAPPPSAAGQTPAAPSVNIRSVVTTQSFAASISSSGGSGSSSGGNNTTTTTSASSIAATASSLPPTSSSCVATSSMNTLIVTGTNTAQPTVHSGLFSSEKDMTHGKSNMLLVTSDGFSSDEENTGDEDTYDDDDDEQEEGELYDHSMLNLDEKWIDDSKEESELSIAAKRHEDDLVCPTDILRNEAASASLLKPVSGMESAKRPTSDFTCNKEEIAKKRKINNDDSGSLGGNSNNSSIADNDDKDGDKDGKKKKNRCVTCRKKVGLTGFECRCGGLFCAIHRYSDKHECSFDYRELGAAEIRRNNPVVVGEKIQKI